MNKKGGELVTEQIIFIILNALFFAVLLFFILRSASADAIAEEVYAKKIGLFIDGMKPGMEINISADDFFKRLEQNKFPEFPIVVEKNIVTVKITKGKGYSFRHFSSLNAQVLVDRNNNAIIIKT